MLVASTALAYTQPAASSPVLTAASFVIVEDMHGRRKWTCTTELCSLTNVHVQAGLPSFFPSLGGVPGQEYVYNAFMHAMTCISGQPGTAAVVFFAATFLVAFLAGAAFLGLAFFAGAFFAATFLVAMKLFEMVVGRILTQFTYYSGLRAE